MSYYKDIKAEDDIMEKIRDEVQKHYGEIAKRINLEGRVAAVGQGVHATALLPG